MMMTTKKIPPAVRTLQCSEHGAVPWRGDLVCSKCGTVYADQVLEVPDFCASCKTRLLPDQHDGRLRWSARPVCPECAAQGR
jgi:hypothetical protein